MSKMQSSGPPGFKKTDTNMSISVKPMPPPSKSPVPSAIETVTVAQAVPMQPVRVFVARA